MLLYLDNRNKFRIFVSHQKTLSIMRFFQAVLKEIPADKIIKHCYPIHHKLITLEERIGDGKCPDCECDSWILLPKESSAVTNGGKDYCECMNCGYMTHL